VSRLSAILGRPPPVTVAILLGLLLLLAGPPLLIEALDSSDEAGPAGRIYGLEPGPRSDVHHDIAECSACHDSQRVISDERCLVCHDEIASRLRTASGLHSRARAQELACARCHREHRGDGPELSGWAAVLEAEKFPHALTHFTLQGAHAAARCASCHKQSPAHFPPLPMRCGAEVCHGGSDPHRGALSSQCEGCHSDAMAWQQHQFDHNDPRVNDRFRLDGKHRQVPCSGCHVRPAQAATPIFRPTPTDCRSCHRRADPHRGRRPQCASCHTPEGWK
jgi:hypothetical protein